MAAVDGKMEVSMFVRVILALCLSMLTVSAEEAHSFKLVYSEFQIHGTAAGGTVTIGYLGNPNYPFTVKTSAGQTEAQLAAALASTPKSIVSLSSDGTTLKVDNTQSGDVYIRIDDAGLHVNPKISDLKA